MKTNKYVIAALFSKATMGKDCSGSSGKVDCGYPGVDQNACEAKGCCWVPVEEDQNQLFLAVGQTPVQDTPWCFNAGDGPTPPPPSGDCAVETE